MVGYMIRDTRTVGFTIEIFLNFLLSYTDSDLFGNFYDSSDCHDRYDYNTRTIIMRLKNVVSLYRHDRMRTICICICIARFDIVGVSANVKSG